MDERELLELKKEIDETKQKVDQLKGERQALIKQLKEEWGCDTIEDAEKKAKKMEQEIENLSISIDEDLEDLESKLNT